MADNKEKKENKDTSQAEQQFVDDGEKDNQEESNVEEQMGEEKNQDDLKEEEEQAPKEEDYEEKIRRLEQEVEESKEKYLRLFSEFENYKRRTSKQQLEMVKTANEDLMQELLPVLDDFERSLSTIKESEADQANFEGIELVYNKFKKILEQKGLTPMDIQPGSEFDSDYQEAVAQTPAQDESYKNKVVDIVEKGYFLGDKVLRFAKVVTGS